MTVIASLVGGALVLLVCLLLALKLAASFHSPARFSSPRWACSYSGARRV